VVKNTTKARQGHFSKKGKFSSKQFVLISSPPEKKEKEDMVTSSHLHSDDECLYER
jgi:hypothetical protein